MKTTFINKGSMVYPTNPTIIAKEVLEAIAFDMFNALKNHTASKFDHWQAVGAILNPLTEQLIATPQEKMVFTNEVFAVLRGESIPYKQEYEIDLSDVIEVITKKGVFKAGFYNSHSLDITLNGKECTLKYYSTSKNLGFLQPDENPIHIGSIEHLVRCIGVENYRKFIDALHVIADEEHDVFYEDHPEWTPFLA